jgi:predicted DNA-binding transcriptional regulator YafY
VSSISKARRLAELPTLLSVRARTTAELAERFGVPQRTIRRDLETLRDSGQGIEEIKRGLYLIPSNSVQLNALEALAVHAAARLLYHHSPTRSYHYQSALEKLAKLLPEPAQRLAFQSAEELRQRKSDDRSLELVAQAWFEQKVEYRSAKGSGQWRRKELEVYFVEVNRDNLAPYAIGFERSFHKKL